MTSPDLLRLIDSVTEELERKTIDWAAASDALLDLQLETTATVFEDATRATGESIRLHEADAARQVLQAMRRALSPADATTARIQR